MKLSLLVPMLHPALELPNGLLTERSFDGGAVTVIVRSVVSHTCNGFAALSQLVPWIVVKAKNDYLNFDKGHEFPAEEFAKKFANAVTMAKAHQQAVADFIKTEIIQHANQSFWTSRESGLCDVMTFLGRLKDQTITPFAAAREGEAIFNRLLTEFGDHRLKTEQTQ